LIKSTRTFVPFDNCNNPLSRLSSLLLGENLVDGSLSDVIVGARGASEGRRDESREAREFVEEEED
jgi:hypothetical protein